MVKFNVIDYPQKSPEWLDWRKEGVGGSDIAVLMGMNGYKTPLELWKEKRGEEVKDFVNPAMQHGNANEDKVRKKIEKRYKTDFLPICAESEENPFFKASLDGYNEKLNLVLEIKCPYSQEKLDEIKKGAIPDEWLMQLQWNMSIVGAETGLLAFWDFNAQEPLVYTYLADPELQEEMKDKAKDFARMVFTGEAPALTDKDYLEIQSQELEALFEEYQRLDTEEKAIQEEKKKTRNQILDFGPESNFKCRNFKVKRIEGRISYDYKKMQADGLPIEEYFSRGKESYRIILP